MRPEPCDLLIEPRWLLPVAPENTVLTNTGLVVRDGRIVGTLSGVEADEQSVMSLASGEASGSAA